MSWGRAAPIARDWFIGRRQVHSGPYYGAPAAVSGASSLSQESADDGEKDGHLNTDKPHELPGHLLIERIDAP